MAGHFQQSSKAMVGPLILRYLRNMIYNQTFISVEGWHPDTGFTGCEPQPVEIINAVLPPEGKVSVITDSSKFSARCSCPISVYGAISRVITDPDISY